MKVRRDLVAVRHLETHGVDTGFARVSLKDREFRSGRKQRRRRATRNRGCLRRCERQWKSSEDEEGSNRFHEVSPVTGLVLRDLEYVSAQASRFARKNHPRSTTTMARSSHALRSTLQEAVLGRIGCRRGAR